MLVILVNLYGRKKMNKYIVPWSVPNITEENKLDLINTLGSGWYSQGKVTKEFENKMAK